MRVCHTIDIEDLIRLYIRLVTAIHGYPTLFSTAERVNSLANLAKNHTITRNPLDFGMIRSNDDYCFRTDTN